MSVVYFMTARELNRVKIGCTTAGLRARLAACRSASPCDLHMEAQLPGDRVTERRLHKRFAAARIRGEWFEITPEIEALMAANPVTERGLPPYAPYRRFREAA